MGDITANTGYTVSEISVRRYNKVVFVKAFVTKTSGGFGTTQVSIAKMSNNILPIQTTRFTCATGTYAYNANHCAYGVVGTQGDISILTSNGSDTAVVFNFWYPIG